MFQIVVLKQIQFLPIGSYHYEAFVYPLFILLLPFGMNVNLMMLIAFFTGLIIDGSYNTFGVHAASSLVLAVSRKRILNWVIPKGMNEDMVPSFQRLKFFLFLRYAALSLLVYLAFYYSMVFFAPVYFIDIMVKTLLSFIFSIFFTLILAAVLSGLD